HALAGVPSALPCSRPTWLFFESSDENHNRYTSYAASSSELLVLNKSSLLGRSGGRCRHVIKPSRREQTGLIRACFCEGEGSALLHLRRDGVFVVGLMAS